MKSLSLLSLGAALLLFICCSSDDEEVVTPVQPSTGIEPLAVTNLNAEAAGVTYVRLTWKEQTLDHYGTVIERAFEGGDFTQIASVSVATTEYTDKNVTEDGEYTYRLYTFINDVTSPTAEVSISFTKTLATPTDLKAEMAGSGLLLTWKDNCEGEEGYVVTRQIGEDEADTWQYLAANTTSVIDTDYEKGSNTYSVMAYYGTLRSEAATVTYEYYNYPEIAISKVETSWYMVSATLDLVADGGEKCSVGVCWSESGTPTVDDNVYTYSSTVNKGADCYGNALDLEYNKTYNLRAWATNSMGTVYSEQTTVKLDDAPQALNPTWEEITDYDFPEEVKLYKTTSTVTGNTINAWYAIADLSTGNVELRTTRASSLTTPTNFITNSMTDEVVYVLVNGGYFDSTPQSFSYIQDRGERLASNIRTLSRTKTYTITRGALGVDENQSPLLYWVYYDGTYAYDVPLRVVDGESILNAPNATTPSVAINWNDTNYSSMGGAPVLLREGRICFDYLLTPSSTYKTNYELLQNDIFAKDLRAPRTAIGYTDDKKMVLMVVDGRSSGGSAGVTLEDLAMLMKGVGCKNVLNLDGGGSTQMCVTNDGTLLNNPSDGSERAVFSYVAFVKKK